jgi:non-heme chloroperoxidase
MPTSSALPTPAQPTAAPAEPGPRVADVRLSTGVRLRYLEQGDPAGPVVILLHGLADSSFSFSRILPDLSGQYRVYAPDQRGHGDSDRPVDGYGPRDLAADVLAFMDALGVERAVLVGHSMGTFVAQQAALAAPGRVAGLILIASAPSARNEVLLEVQRSLAALPDTVPREFVKEFQLSTMHQPTPDEFLARVVAESLKAPSRVWRAALGGLLEWEPLTGPIQGKTPVLLLWGELDAIFSRADQEALLAALPAATLREYRETGHAPHWERPREVVRDLERFLRTTLA